MTDETRGEMAADETCAAAWIEFEEVLAGHLSVMVDAEDHLILELPGSDAGGMAPYAQFAAFGNGTMVRAEVSSNAFLAERHQFDLGQQQALVELGFTLQHSDDGRVLNYASDLPILEAEEQAARVVGALRDVVGVPHPHLLTHQAWGPAADQVDLLGLCSSSEVEVEGDGAGESRPETPRPLRKAFYLPKSREKLLELVGRLLAQKYDGAVASDEDGDFVLEHMDQTVWVRVRHGQPAIEIMTCLAHDVRSRRGAAVEVGILNRTNSWVKWDLHDRAVWQRLFVPGFPFVPFHLDSMLDVFAAAMKEHRDDLVLRTGGKTGG